MSLSTSSDVVAKVPPQQVVTLYQAASDYVSRATGIALDGSEESLAIVDHYISRIREKTGPAQVKPAVLRLVAAALGVYVGELCISRFGGSWIVLPKPLSETDDETEAEAEIASLGRWRVELVAAPLRVDPMGMAAVALQPADATDATDDDFGFTLAPEHTYLYEPLHLALSRVAPVAADYYFSLTGRFETLSHIVDLVMELRQRAAAAAAPSDDATGAAEQEPPAPQ